MECFRASEDLRGYSNGLGANDPVPVRHILTRIAPLRAVCMRRVVRRCSAVEFPLGNRNNRTEITVLTVVDLEVFEGRQFSVGGVRGGVRVFHRIE